MGTSLEATRQLELDVAATIDEWILIWEVTPYEAWIALQGPLVMKAPSWEDVACLARARAWHLKASDAA